MYCYYHLLWKLFAFQVYIVLNYEITWLHVKVMMEIILCYKITTKIKLKFISGFVPNSSTFK